MRSRIIHAIHSISPLFGGTTEAVRLLSGNSAEIESLVISSDPPALRYGESWNCRTIATGPSVTKFGWNPRWNPVLRKELQPPCCVIIHGMWQYHTLATARQAKRMNIPYWVFPHGMLDPWALRQSRWQKRAAWWCFNKWVVQNASTLCFTTEEERTSAGNIVNAASQDQLVLPLGVETPPDKVAILKSEFSELCPTLAGRSVILFLGRLHPKKGCDLLIEAFGRSKKQNRGSTAFPHLRLAGPPDSEAYLAQLTSQCEQLGLRIGEDVSFPGMVTGRDKWRELAGAEVMILPSHQENFALVVGEALACGRPVLLSDKVNTSQVALNHGAGFSDTDTLEGTERLLSKWSQTSHATREEMSMNALALYHSHFSAHKARVRFLQAAMSSPGMRMTLPVHH